MAKRAQKAETPEATKGPTKAELAAQAKAEKQAAAEAAKAKADAAKAKADAAAAKVKAKEDAAKEKADAKAAKAAEKAAAKAEQGDGTKTGGVVDRSRYSYETTKDIKTASGRASVDNADPLAVALRGKPADAVIALVAENGGTVNEAWANLNQGLARMSAGNVLRKLAKRTEGVMIDGKRIKAAA